MINSDKYHYSFFVYNGQETLRKIDAWRQTLTWITPFYAIKSNPIPNLLDDLISRDTGFDCASKGEIKTMLARGVSPSKIVYSNVAKEESHILYAKRKGVLLTTADTLDEVAKI